MDMRTNIPIAFARKVCVSVESHTHMLSNTGNIKSIHPHIFLANTIILYILYIELVYIWFTAVYGGLDLHGRQRLPVQSYLADTAVSGATQITVSHDIDWQVCAISMLPSIYSETCHCSELFVFEVLDLAFPCDTYSYRI